MDPYKRSMSEEQMLSTLEDYARLQGGYLWHVRDARGQNLAGLPDTVIIIPRRLVWDAAARAHLRPGVVGLFEIKTQRDRVSPLQAEVLDAIATASDVVGGIIRPRPRSLREHTLDDALELLGRPPTDSV